VNNFFKVSLLVCLVSVFFTSIQAEAGRRCEQSARRSSVSLSFNLGFFGINTNCYECDYAPAYYERRVIRQPCPVVRERVVVYPAAPAYYEEVIIAQPCYRERVVVRSPYFW
jgi:hypothetical protein